MRCLEHVMMVPLRVQTMTGTLIIQPLIQQVSDDDECSQQTTVTSLIFKTNVLYNISYILQKLPIHNRYLLPNGLNSRGSKCAIWICCGRCPTELLLGAMKIKSFYKSNSYTIIFLKRKTNDLSGIYCFLSLIMYLYSLSYY